MTKPDSIGNTGGKTDGKTVLVTGASRGIGREIAFTLARRGDYVFAGIRDKSRLAELEAISTRDGLKLVGIEMDVESKDSIELAISKIEARKGPIEILVNNAGIYVTEPVCNHSLTLWNQVIATNLTSCLISTSRVLKQMIASKWGRIVNVSSISGKVAEPFGAAYSASKFGLIGLTQATALEVAKFGITANAICPGWVNTDMAFNQLNDPSWCQLNAQPYKARSTEVECSQVDCSQVDQSSSSPGEDMMQLDALEIARLSVPQERFIEVQEVADLVAFLCTESARGITGQALNICGGLSLH